MSDLTLAKLFALISFVLFFGHLVYVWINL